MATNSSDKNKKDKIQLQKLKHTYMIEPCTIEIIKNLYQSGMLLGEIEMDKVIKFNLKMKNKLEQAKELIDEITDWFFKEQILPNYEIEYDGDFYYVNVPYQIAPWTK